MKVPSLLTRTRFRRRDRSARPYSSWRRGPITLRRIRRIRVVLYESCKVKKPVKRAVISAAWLIGSVVPLTFAVTFFFGCCVLPFHQTLHKVAPLCAIASMMTVTDDGDSRQSTPAREKSEKTAKRNVPSVLPAHISVTATSQRATQHFVPDSLGYRSFIALGAMRCDDDVGLRLSLLDTFRI